MELNETAPLFDNLPAALERRNAAQHGSLRPGLRLHFVSHQNSPGAPALLEAAAIRDFGFVFLDGKRVGILDRRNPGAKIPFA